MKTGLHEECGVFGVIAPHTTDVASMTYVALYALQHRGQESCGIVVNDRGVFSHHKDLGLVLPTMGTVSIDGEIIGKGISFPRSIGLLLENPIFIDEFTGAKNLSLLCDIKRLVSQAQIGDTLRRVGLNQSDKRPFRK